MSEDIFQLPQPGPAKPDVLRVVPLGGLGEVGRNMTVLETEGKILIVDCGVLFPEEIQPGVDLILPDFTYIQDRMADVVGVVLTVETARGHSRLRFAPDTGVRGTETFGASPADHKPAGQGGG